MQARLNMWRSRDLSLIGKILVLNTLIMSLFVYRLTVLPSLSQNVIHKINKIWSKFLWNDKKPKIAWKILCAPKINGGMGLSDFYKRDQSLKCQWITLYLRDPVVAFLADSALGNKLGPLMWKCNFSPKDCHILTQCRTFWYDVLKAWSKFNFFHPSGIDEIVEQVIWNNSHIRSAKHLLCNYNLIDLGVIKIKDLLNASSQFMTVSQFKHKFPRVNYLVYISILRAIPVEWKRVIVLATPSINLHLNAYELALATRSIVKIAYGALHINVSLLDEKCAK